MQMSSTLIVCWAFLASFPSALTLAKQPHIVFVLADDYGYNDIGYHGSEIKTPNLDALCANGVRLENYYVQPSCSPSRTQFLSGRYQIHTGLQHGIIWDSQPNGLPLDSPTVADKLKEAGYATHVVGKWHVGFYKPAYLPINRGFDTFYGFYTGSVMHFRHTRKWTPSSPEYLDLHDQDKPVWDKSGHYSTHMYTDKAIQRIREHNASKAVHSPMEVPQQYKRPYSHIKDKTRRTYAGMVAAMDEGVANVTKALKDAGMWEDTIFIFSTDNGGDVNYGANNFPLRGNKGSLWQGGIRAVGFVHSSKLETSGTSNNALIHISDWFPTFVRLAGGSLNGTKPLDGHDQWDTISKAYPSPRKELLVNIDPLTPLKGTRKYNHTFDTRVSAALIVGDWKIVTGDPGDAGWNHAPPYSKGYPETRRPSFAKGSHRQNVLLMNIAEDPREEDDVSTQHPKLVKEMLDRLAEYHSTSVPVRYPPRFLPDSNPALRGGVWQPWQKDDPRPGSTDLPVRQVSPLQEKSPVRQVSPLQEKSPVRQVSPLQEKSPVRQVSPVQEKSPVRQVSPVRMIKAISIHYNSLPWLVQYFGLFFLSFPVCIWLSKKFKFLY